MTVKYLRVFTAVYRELNITRAAELLHMTQPAVSRSIREMEDYYGVRLFERMNHRLYRTQTGDALYARALHILEAFDGLENELRNRDECGILRIGASVTLGNFLIPGVVQKLQNIYPGLHIRVIILNTGNIEKAILENEIDIAAVEGSVFSEYIYSELLTRDSLALILPPCHPLARKPSLSISELSDYPLLLRENGSAGRTFLNNTFAFHGVKLEPAWESASTQALIHAVACGLGISILPKPLIQRDLLSGVIVTREVCDEPFIRESYVIRHRQKYVSQPAAEFMALCRSESDIFIKTEKES